MNFSVSMFIQLDLKCQDSNFSACMCLSYTVKIIYVFDIMKIMINKEFQI